MENKSEITKEKLNKLQVLKTNLCQIKCSITTHNTILKLMKGQINQMGPILKCSSDPLYLARMRTVDSLVNLTDKSEEIESQILDLEMSMIQQFVQDSIISKLSYIQQGYDIAVYSLFTLSDSTKRRLGEYFPRYKLRFNGNEIWISDKEKNGGE